MSQGKRQSHVLEMGDGLFALQNLHFLDGRLGLYPKLARGSAPVNCYLIRVPGESLLIETGYTVDEDTIAEQIREIHVAGSLMSIFPMRVQEPPSMCNATSLATRFQPSRFYGVSQGRIDHWANFHVSADPSLPGVLSHEREVPITPTTRLAGMPSFRVGLDRQIDIVNAPIRLIVTRWLFDQVTGTLFTSDMFSHIWSDTPHPRWVASELSRDDSAEQLHRFLLGGRYWWLPGSRARIVRDAVKGVFTKYDVQNIAPTAGAILRGRDIVKRQVESLCDILDKMDGRHTSPSYIPRSIVNSI